MFFAKKRLVVMVAVWAVACVCASACKSTPAQEKQAPELPYSQMRSGDLVFRLGTGAYAQLLNMMPDTLMYSHVGFLVEKDSSWMVVHAVPRELDGPDDFERVKMESLDAFLAPDLAIIGTFAHTPVKRPDRMVTRALEYVRDSVPFDNNFDLSDTTALYCTEMVWRLFLMEGIDLSEGRRSYRSVSVFKDGCITANDILQYPGLEKYFSF